MKNVLKRSVLITSLVFTANLLSAAQSDARSAVNERNVRAQMMFLAGDAMQGRGSGTQFEWIAAEYVGSQFMQSGIEPAGDLSPDGKPGYVQTVTISRGGFTENPTLKYGTTTLTHGNEMIVLRTNSGNAVGKLQKLAWGGKPEADSAVFIKPPQETDPRAVMQAIQTLAASGASIVIVRETPQWRAGWATSARRRLTFTPTSGKPFVILVASQESSEAISKLADGTPIEFGGTPAAIQTTRTWNAAGKITGSDPAIGSEVILLSSHLDHLGVRENTPGDDKIFNGADDDASGTVAVMELARILASGKRPKRTVYFVSFGSEEAGGGGSGYFVNNLPFPKEKLIANLQWEMIGRPDAKVKPEELWLTGYERSNLGPELARRGAKLVQDPHPSENFFQRSDNFTLARQGVIAHTVSSFGLHTDYHRASDELDTIDFVHMSRSINSMVLPIEWLINNDFRPTWVEGKRP